MDTDTRLRNIEDRIEAIEAVIKDARAKFDAFAKGPGRKILAAFGVKP